MKVYFNIQNLLGGLKHCSQAVNKADLPLKDQIWNIKRTKQGVESRVMTSSG